MVFETHFKGLPQKPSKAPTGPDRGPPLAAHNLSLEKHIKRILMIICFCGGGQGTYICTGSLETLGLCSTSGPTLHIALRDKVMLRSILEPDVIITNAAASTCEGLLLSVLQLLLLLRPNSLSSPQLYIRKP